MRLIAITFSESDRRGLMTSDSLLSVADCYTDLEKIKQDIQKERTR